MKSPYFLKNVHKRVAYGETCLSASIWHEGREIGNFRDCPDSGKPLFVFHRVQDRTDFEKYIQLWWEKSDHVLLCNLHLRELIEEQVMQELPLHTKMRCWITLETGIIETDASWKWKSRNARYMMQSFQSFVPGTNR